jgi:cytochrome c biogenesis protein CcmG/thiol:disulfide interchange protein DsbE
MPMQSKKSTSISYLVLFTIGIIFLSFFLQKSKQPMPVASAATPLPAFSIPTLYHPEIPFTPKNLAGKVFLLHFFASWCPACRAEHETFLTIKNTSHIPIYGIAYKDNPQNAEEWLRETGNPYNLVGSDPYGELGSQFHLYGTPQTFIIDKKGQIRYQFTGALDLHDWQTILLPLVNEYLAGR